MTKPLRGGLSFASLRRYWRSGDGSESPQPADSGIAGQIPSEDANDWDLFASENVGAPTTGRESDRAEALADEQQDVTSSLCFPLHWTTAALSWTYLFDLAIACDLLAPRPDDLVLDFAAGTCWASESLSRLGVRTVSIDLSVEMMRRGRARLAADSRLIFRDQAGFVAARGQALPFLDRSFDGVLCMNALHHLPSYAAGLAEIFRVLKDGSRAVFSEPGATHATAPLSQFRMREEGIIEKNVSLGLVHRLAMQAGFSAMRVVPLRSAATYAFDYTGNANDESALTRMWNETMVHGPGEHARFVLFKGGERPADTWLPAQQLGGRLAARITAVGHIDEVRAGQTFTNRLRIENRGSAIWKARGRRFGGQVTCGLKVCSPDGAVIREDLGRTPLLRDVAPGETIETDVTVGGELAPGRYQLRYDMVVEGVTWLEFHGSPCLHVPFEVLA